MDQTHPDKTHYSPPTPHNPADWPDCSAAGKPVAASVTASVRTAAGCAAPCGYNATPPPAAAAAAYFLVCSVANLLTSDMRAAAPRSSSRLFWISALSSGAATDTAFSISTMVRLMRSSSASAEATPPSTSVALPVGAQGQGAQQHARGKRQNQRSDVMM